MVRLSKRPISKDILEKLYQLFYTVIGARHDFFKVTNELISSQERIMIAKRLGIIFLLNKNLSTTGITQRLNVSSATVLKFRLLFEEKDSLLKRRIIKVVARRQLGRVLTDIVAALLLQPGIRIGHTRMKRDLDRQRSSPL